MENSEIINIIAREKMVEEIVNNINYSKQEDEEDIKDLAQDTYINLLLLDNEKLNHLYETGQLKFFIARMLTNNIHSVTSRYHYNYRINKNKHTDITDAILAEKETI